MPSCTSTPSMSHSRSAVVALSACTQYGAPGRAPYRPDSPTRPSCWARTRICSRFGRTATNKGDAVNELCERLGIEFPILPSPTAATSLPRSVERRGLGVLGPSGSTLPSSRRSSPGSMSTGRSPLRRRHRHPASTRAWRTRPGEARGGAQGMVPEGHRTFTKDHPGRARCPELPPDAPPTRAARMDGGDRRAPDRGDHGHPKSRPRGQRLRHPPDEVIAQVHGSGRLIAALAGSVKHARSHRDAGVRHRICQAARAVATPGDVGSIVLWPERSSTPSPPARARRGGVGSGRQMPPPWSWARPVCDRLPRLTVEEADIPPGADATYLAASSRDTVRSRSFTGKPCRMLTNDWPSMGARRHARSLPMPLQMMVAIECVSRGSRTRPGQRRRLHPPARSSAGPPDATDEGRRRRHDDRVRRRHHPPPA